MLLMSVVVLVVIFLIFYQIVRDKTKDIGIIKAVGGSEAGVAGIFLTYGQMIGVVGGGLGAVTGSVFVTHTNQIHEWIFRMTGIVIWDRSVYLFDRIPDVVRWSDVALYYAIALVSGVMGAIIPAVLAALEDPVEAVRYE
jgi:lipoprotein-releasing system permease protein